jgi:hypothetical protein
LKQGRSLYAPTGPDTEEDGSTKAGSEYQAGENAMLKFVWNRNCKKCHGQCYLEKAEDGEYLVCIQCGCTENVTERKPVKVPVTCK